MTVPVSVATTDQAPDVGAMLHAFNTEFQTPTPAAHELAGRFQRLLGRDDVLVLLSGDPGVPTGFAFLTLRPTPYDDGPLAQLEELYVRPELRGSGTGTALLRAAMERVGERGCREVHINVDEVDAGARRFYERHGFTNFQPGTHDRMLCYLCEL